MAKKKVKRKKSSKKSTYKRGSLGKAIYALFDKVGVDKCTYDQAEACAKSVLPTTKFNKYHHSWYKNKYREMNREKKSSKKKTAKRKSKE